MKSCNLPLRKPILCKLSVSWSLKNIIWLIIRNLDFNHVLLFGGRVIRISPFANRLAMSMPSHIQYLRCLTNYKALRFSSPILTLAKNLINRMTERSLNSGGNYVSVHLRFEEVQCFPPQNTYFRGT